MGRRLTLVVPSLALGGAERVVARMANHWAARGDAVTVITLSATTTDTYPLDSPVTRVALDLMRDSRGPIGACFNNWIRVRRLRDAIRESQPDTVISFTDRMNIVTLLACRPLDVDTVISERIDPSRQPIGRIWEWLRRKVYPRARALVVQTQSVREQMKSVMRGHMIYVIPNAIDEVVGGVPRPLPPNTANASPRPAQIVAMGRLAPQKGFDLLIEAFAKVAASRPTCTLTILGEGSERQRLQELSRARGLSQRIRLPGWIPDPFSVLQTCDLFVLSSRYEGFPNALLEAMAAGLAVISFDCPSGPAEIIRHDVDGLLVPPEDVSALSEAIERLISDSDLRDRLRKEAVNVTERFSVSHYFARWDKVLQKEVPDWDGQAKIWTNLICCRISVDNIETAARLLSEHLGIHLERRQSVNYAKPYYRYRAPTHTEEIFLTLNEDEDGISMKDEFPVDALVLEVVARVSADNAERRRQIQEAVRRAESQCADRS
jgi:GalNAc-alpha-(1->4)-GalNAc-alpha-(1->3)-diNAcBac-PP-undecaprenol alpha-1,4-N-acetyl-D-galactosaminyltransferase